MAIYQGDEKIVDRYVGGTLVTRAYQGDKLIFDAYSELSGTLPLAVRSRASQVLENYIIYGESVQDGTPAPDNPVEVTGLGVRTENLYNKNDPDIVYSAYMDSYGVIRTGGYGNAVKVSGYIPINGGRTYIGTNLMDSGSQNHYSYYDANKQRVGGGLVSNNMVFNSPIDAAYIRTTLIYRNTEDIAVITEGSTAPETYIPYGYKLPIKVTAGGTTTDYPIYIGDSQLMRIPGTEYADYVDYEKGKIVRQVKKLVLTGNEPTQRYSKNVFFITIPKTQATTSINNFCLSNKYKYATGGLYGLMTTDMSAQAALTEISSPRYICVHDSRFDASGDLKSYLADQYAAGTPVTFWYALETPVEEDPPVPFPDITIPEGEVTIDIEGDLKPQATVKGRINPVHYAYHVDPTISNPSDAVTYLADAIGKTPASMGASTFNYGDWADAFFMPKPCMLGFDGKVKYYLDPNDYSKKLDGTASDYDNLAFEGNVMLQFPLIWWKFEAGETEGEGYFHVSNVQIDDSYKCWCNINSKGEQINHFYMAAYNGCIYDGKMRSISGLQLLPWSTTAYSSSGTYAVGARVHNGNKMYQCITAVEEAEPFDETKWEQYAYNGQTSGQEEVDACIALNTSNGIEWYTDVYADRVLINGLLTLISKSLNSQAVFGRGLDSGSQAAKENYTTGTLNNKGLFYGVTANGNNAVKVFGIENWWGCVWRRTAGLIGASTGYKYKLTYDTSDGTTVSGYNSTANGYKVCNTQQPANGYVTKMQYGDWGFVPMATSGANTTYYSDYYYRGNGFALFGGYSSSGVGCGAWCLGLVYGFTYRYWDFAAAPSCKPLV